MASLRARLTEARPGPGARLETPQSSLALRELAALTGLPAGDALAGRSVLVRTARQIAAAQALVEMDGLARRIVLCPPDLVPDHFEHVIRAAEVDAIVSDAPEEALPRLGPPIQTLERPHSPPSANAAPARETEWVLFTSGTMGAPKLVAHSLAGLTGAIPQPPAGTDRPVWATFYDIRRYGGLQILLRALTGGCTLVLSDPEEELPDHVARLARLGATHITGTPSHWRKLLMSSDAGRIAPPYVRLSGEIADQAVLDGLKAKFPQARIVHAYASTEAGVGFEVDDGLEGFPENFIRRPGPVELRVVDGSLRIRSPRAAMGYLGPDASALADPDGFVDTGDMVELSGGRWRFVGRRNGVINVGGLKVHPEEVEAVVNRHPAVRMSLVRARRNPITGAVVTADVALVEPQLAASPEQKAALRADIMAMCRTALPAHKAPATIRFVPDLMVTAGGKLDRSHD